MAILSYALSTKTFDTVHTCKNTVITGMLRVFDHGQVSPCNYLSNDIKCKTVDCKSTGRRSVSTSAYSVRRTSHFFHHILWSFDPMSYLGANYFMVQLTVEQVVMATNVCF